MVDAADLRLKTTIVLTTNLTNRTLRGSRAASSAHHRSQLRWVVLHLRRRRQMDT